MEQVCSKCGKEDSGFDITHSIQSYYGYLFCDRCVKTILNQYTLSHHKELSENLKRFEQVQK